MQLEAKAKQCNNSLQVSNQKQKASLKRAHIQHQATNNGIGAVMIPRLWVMLIIMIMMMMVMTIKNSIFVRIHFNYAHKMSVHQNAISNWLINSILIYLLLPVYLMKISIIFNVVVIFRV
jgi:hypothetical protein